MLEVLGRMVVVVSLTILGASLTSCSQPDMRLGGENSGDLTNQIRSSSQITSCDDYGSTFSTSIQVLNSSDRPINASFFTVQFYRGNDMMGEAVFNGPDPLPRGMSFSKQSSVTGYFGDQPLTCRWGSFNVYGR